MTPTKKNKTPRVFNAVQDRKWAITEDSLQTILSIAARENDLEALQAKAGTPLQYTRSVSIRDGVATIPIEGPIFRYANLFTEYSGGTSSEELAKDLQAAIDNPAVKAIILDLDSPGGEVNGTNEMADMIYAARASKPVIAYVGGYACSAAYWLASAASEIVIDATASVGSIGVIATYRLGKEQGETIQIVSSQSPRKNPDIKSQDGRDQIQAEIDALAAVFVASVAKYRGVSEQTVIDKFGNGGIAIGTAAIEAGMADRLGSYESLHAELSGRKTQTQTTMKGTRSMVDESEKPKADQSELEKVMAANAELLKRQNELQAMLEREQNARIEATAAAMTEHYIRAGVLTPAETEAQKALYIRLAKDDASDGGIRVDLLKEAWGARPKLQATIETIPSGIIPSALGSTPIDKQAEAERRAKLLALSGLGRKVAEKKES